ncbi:hypothetical protein AAC387_Pa02g0740 [Persea americana]
MMFYGMEEPNNSVAPFVLKTYQMVNDASTDSLISWGPNNDSFIVFDPLDFSQRLLPTYFKHNNFSSFVRQLNTFGFRKVDPDKWEFPNEFFLRGQQHLLTNILRGKNQTHPTHHTLISRLEDEEEMEKATLSELAQLQQEQRGMEEEIQGMGQRLQATEKKPEKMMALLLKVMENPDVLSRKMVEKEARKRLGEKRRLTRISSPSSSYPSNTREVDDVVKINSVVNMNNSPNPMVNTATATSTGMGIGSGDMNSDIGLPPDSLVPEYYYNSEMIVLPAWGAFV